MLSPRVQADEIKSRSSTAEVDVECAEIINGNGPLNSHVGAVELTPLNHKETKRRAIRLDTRGSDAEFVLLAIRIVRRDPRSTP